MKINTKINLNFIALSLVAVIFTSSSIGFFVYKLSFNAIKEERNSTLAGVLRLKAFEVENYFNSIKSDLLTFANNPLIINAMQDFNSTFNKYNEELILTDNSEKHKQEVIKYYANEFSNEFRIQNGEDELDIQNLINLLDPASFSLQYSYILTNPNKATEKSNLDYADDNTAYSAAHKKYHSKIRKIMQNLGFYDVFLISLDGRVVYTVNKELDFAASLNNNMLKSTSLGEVFAKARDTAIDDSVAISNFSAYLPSYNKDAAFIATPIVSDDNKTIGVLVFQISPEVINNIMTNNKNWDSLGLGKTGEIYLVDEDYKSRSISRFVVQDFNNYINIMQKNGMSKSDVTKITSRNDNTGVQINNTFGVNDALKGNSGNNIYTDYRGIEVISAYKPLNILGLNLVMLAEMDVSEAFSTAYKLRDNIIIIAISVSAVMLMISLLLSFYFRKSILFPINYFSKTVSNIAKDKDLTRRVNYRVNDEFGEMGKAIDFLIVSLQNLCMGAIESTKIIKEKMRDYDKSLESQTKNKKDNEKDKNQVHSKEENIDLEDNDSDDQDLDLSIEEPYTDNLKQDKDSHDLQKLCNKLVRLSKDFKVIEKEQGKKKGW